MINNLIDLLNGFSKKGKNRPLLLFMHIPKTGGNSLSNYVQKVLGENKILYLTYRVPKNPFIINDIFNNDYLIEPYINEIKMQENFDAVFGHFRYGLHKNFPDRECKYITFLREPINQVISSFFSMKKQWGLLSKDFNNISDAITDSRFPVNTQTFFTSGITDYDVMRNDPALTLKTAISNLQNHFLFIGRTEEYSNSINKLFDLLKWENNHYFHENKGNYKIEISKEEIEIIKKIYFLDIELYKLSPYNL